MYLEGWAGDAQKQARTNKRGGGRGGGEEEGGGGGRGGEGSKHGNLE